MQINFTSNDPTFNWLIIKEKFDGITNYVKVVQKQFELFSSCFLKKNFFVSLKRKILNMISLKVVIFVMSLFPYLEVEGQIGK